MTTNDRGKGHIHNIVSFTCVGCLLFILGEIIVRAFITFPTSSIPDPELGWLRKPNSVFFHTKEGRAINTFNSIGFNDDEVSTVQSNRSNLLVLGDSFTEALHVPKAKNFTSVTEDRANCVDVFNGGRADLSPIQYHVVARKLSRVLSPEAIILTINYGDMEDINRHDAEIIWDSNNENIKDIIFKKQTTTTLAVNKRDYVFSRSALMTFIARRLKALEIDLPRTKSLNETVIASENHHPNNHKIKAILEYEFDAIESIAPLYVLYIPKLEYQPDGKALPTRESKQFEQILTEVTDKNKIEFVSVKKYMQESYQNTKRPPVGFPNNNILAGHLNEIGHQTVATALLELLNIECVSEVYQN